MLKNIIQIIVDIIMISIPYNIFTCSNCKNIQTKYLSDLN